MLMDVSDTFSLLLGNWSLRRELDDRISGHRGVFEGVATVILDPEDPSVAAYEECGRVEFGSHSGPSHRALKLTRLPDGAVAVWFADGRPFFELDLSCGNAEALHPCHADDYRLAFELHSDELIVERWQVRGPNKDYDAETVWRRAHR